MKKNYKNYQGFFGTNGLTSTSANYVMTKAKEITRLLGNLDNLNFCNVFVEDLNSTDNRVIVEEGINEEAFKALTDQVKMKAKLNALISWLAEAIKGREYQLSEIDDMSYQDWLRDVKGITDLTYGIPDVEGDMMPHYINDIEYIEQNFNVKELNEYLFLENMCAAMGKFVHPYGAYAKAKERAEKENGKHYLKETRASNLIYTTEVSVPLDDIAETFFKIQDEHREYQKRFNEIRFRVEKAVQQHNDEEKSRIKQLDLDRKDRITKMSAIRAKHEKEMNEWKIAKRNELRSAKIIIPNDLRDAYEYVSNYAK